MGSVRVEAGTDVVPEPYIALSASDTEVGKAIETLIDTTWPPYTLYGRPPEECSYVFDWSKVYDFFPHYQFGVYDRLSGELVACGNSVPLRWDRALDDLPDGGWDWAIRTAFEQYKSGESANSLVALSITVKKTHRGRGLSGICLSIMKFLARKFTLHSVLVPVRPAAKSLHPHVDIAEFTTWKLDDGRPFDPWIRTHLRLGGRIIKPCRRSITIVAPISDWEMWTGRQFLESGAYVLPDMLSTLSIDTSIDRGTYIEASVWIHHQV